MSDVTSSVSWEEQNITQDPTYYQDYGMAPDVIQLMKYANVARIINLSARAILIAAGIITCICASGLLWKRRNSHTILFITLMMNLLLTCVVHFGYNLLVDTIYYSRWFEFGQGEAICRIDAFLSYMCKMAIVYQIISLLVFTMLTKIKPRWIHIMNSPKSIKIFMVIFWIFVFACNIHRLTAEGLVHSLYHDYCSSLTENHVHSYFIFVAHFVVILLVPCFLSNLLVAIMLFGQRFKDTDMDPSTYSQNRKLSISLAVLFSVSHTPLVLYYLVLLCGYDDRKDTQIGFYFVKDLMLFCHRLYTTLIPGCVLISLKKINNKQTKICHDRVTLLEMQDAVDV